MIARWHSMWGLVAEGLERYLLRGSFDPLLTAAELRTLPPLLAGMTGFELAQAAQNSGQEEHAWELAAQAADAYRQLVTMHPSRPILMLQLSACLQLGPPQWQQRARHSARLTLQQVGQCSWLLWHASFTAPWARLQRCRLAVSPLLAAK